MAGLQYSGIEEIFKRIIGRNVINNFVARLYSNARTPGLSDTISNFTEVTGGGYASIPILESEWTIGIVSSIMTMYKTVNFHFTGAVPVIYGGYLTNSLNNILIDAQILVDAPVEIGAGGGDIEITFNLKFNNS